ncbi:hypothetical protein Pcinc_011156 [Petrolisthes cinctipes]|uniref:Uncharacterized protein n=1 Tax=Petrolisthes cinctipes TaxID=88211 RepID=A0AAE1G3H3_PETCI|nr:hypothetical protein Pcinc_011156 [Petrolisthes cinctipes]
MHPDDYISTHLHHSSSTTPTHQEATKNLIRMTHTPKPLRVSSCWGNKEAYIVTAEGVGEGEEEEEEHMETVVQKEEEMKRGSENIQTTAPMKTDQKEDQNEEDEYEYVAPDGGWGWVIVCATFTLIFFGSSVLLNFGIMFSSFLLHSSSTTVSLIINLGMFISGVTSYLMGSLVEEFGWRRVTVVSSFLFGFGYVISAFATSGVFLIFSFSVLSVSQTLNLWNIALLVIPYYFTRLRTVANSITFTGAALSQMVIPLLSSYLEEEYGFRGSTLILGGLSLNCCVSGLVLHPVQWHTRKRKKGTQHQQQQQHKHQQQQQHHHRGYVSSVMRENDESNEKGMYPLLTTTTMKRKEKPRVDETSALYCPENVTNVTSSYHTTLDTKMKQDKNYSSLDDNELSHIESLNKPYINKNNNNNNKSRSNSTTTTTTSSVKETDTTKTSSPRTKSRLKRIMSTGVQNLRHLRSPMVVVIVCSFSMFLITVINIMTLAPYAMRVDGFTAQEASFCISVFGGCNLAARVLSSLFVFCPAVTSRVWFVLGSSICGLSIVAFSLVRSLMLKAVMFAISGLGYGLALPLFNLIIVEELGLPMLLITLSITSIGNAVFAIVVGTLIGVMRDVSGSYVASLCFCACCVLLSSLLCLLLPVFRSLEESRQTHRQYQHQPLEQYMKQNEQQKSSVKQNGQQSSVK